jgi:antitoxin MazE
MHEPDFSALVAHEARVFKSGHSLAVRIPAAIAKFCRLADGASLEVAAEQGLIYLRKVPSKSLDELLDAITPANIHVEVFDGPPVGVEGW